jgi:hypothetical protein
MKETEILILILIGIIIYLSYYYQKKIKEIEAQKRVIVPMIPGVSAGWDYQTMEYYLQRTH